MEFLFILVPILIIVLLGGYNDLIERWTRAHEVRKKWKRKE
jgi:hypothetical protein